MLLEELLISKWNHIATFTAPEDPLEDENALILTNFQALVLPPSCGIHAPLIYASLNLNDGLTLDEPEPIPSLVIESSVFYITVSASNRHICETFIETLVILNSQIPDLIVTDECLPTHSNTLTLSTFSQGLSGYAEIVAEEIVSNLRKIHQPTLQGSNCVGESENFPNSISAHYTPRDTKLSPNSGQVQALSENLQQTRATKSQFAEGQSLTDHEAKQWCSSGFGRVFGRKTKSATGPIDISWPSLGQSSDQSPSQSAAHKRPRGEKALNRSRFLWFRRKFGRSQKQNTHEREIMAAIRAIATLASIIEYTRSQGCLAIVMDFSTSNTLDDSPRRTNELKRAMILWLTNYLGLGVTPWLISCQAPPSMDLDEKLGQTRSVLRMHAVPEKTVLISPVPLTRGDHVLRQIRSHGTLSYITHHGLYIGQGIIVHFSGNESALRSLIFPDQLSTKLRKVSVTEFMKFGGRIIVQKYQKNKLVFEPSLESGNLASAITKYSRTTTDNQFVYSNEEAARRAEFVYIHFHLRIHPELVVNQVDPEKRELFQQITKMDFNFPAYNLLRNNCEHFCRWCKTGEAISLQTEFASVALDSFFRGFKKID